MTVRSLARALVSVVPCLFPLCLFPLCAQKLDLTQEVAKVRAKADMQDYIQRAVTLIHNYVPPNSILILFDPTSRRVLRAQVWSSLGGDSKDPVTVDALFETLPDGITHLASATLEAKTKKVAVKTRNTAFQK